MVMLKAEGVEVAHPNNKKEKHKRILVSVILALTIAITNSSYFIGLLAIFLFFT